MVKTTGDEVLDIVPKSLVIENTGYGLDQVDHLCQRLKQLAQNRETHKPT